MALHANMNRDEKKRSKPYSTWDFMYYDEPEIEAPVESPEVLSQRIAKELFKL